MSLCIRSSHRFLWSDAFCRNRAIVNEIFGEDSDVDKPKKISNIIKRKTDDDKAKEGIDFNDEFTDDEEANDDEEELELSTSLSTLFWLWFFFFDNSLTSFNVTSLW